MHQHCCKSSCTLYLADVVKVVPCMSKQSYPIASRFYIRAQNGGRGHLCTNLYNVTMPKHLRHQLIATSHGYRGHGSSVMTHASEAIVICTLAKQSCNQINGSCLSQQRNMHISYYRYHDAARPRLHSDISSPTHCNQVINQWIALSRFTCSEGTQQPQQMRLK